MNKTITYILLFILGGFMFVACNNNNEEIDKLKEENAAIKQSTSEKDTLISQYFKAIDEIENNLSLIAQHENSIVLDLRNGIENKKSKQEKVIENIQFINSLLDQNKEKINKLTQQLSKSNFKIVELQNIIERLNLQITDKDYELVALKNQLIKKNFQIDLLNNSLDSLSLLSMIQEELIGMQEDELNTAFYCYGTTKELINNGIITKEGGVIGLGKSIKLAENMNKSYFRKIDITKSYSIPLAVKKATLISNHPQGTYKFIEDKTIEKLVVTNPKAFWETSKYLVIVVE